MSRSVEQFNPSSEQEHLIQAISTCIQPLGYQVVHLELQSHRQKVLRVYIDHLDSDSNKTIGIEDCVKVSRCLDEFLDQSPEAQSLLPGAYELEVSSPGLDRPLRTPSDFQKFAGREIRVHTFRPLTESESGNPEYQKVNPKQKNYLGTLLGLEGNLVCIALKDSKSTKKSDRKKEFPKLEELHGVRVTIPLPLISKANLEPKFDFEESNERE